MITDLCLRGLGTVAQADVQFRPGLNVITGETGTGKTMLLRALTLVMGGKSDASWVRHGSAEAVVDAVFALTPSVYARAAELAAEVCPPDLEETVVALGRVIGARSRASVNGRPVPASLQSEVAENLISVHGQHEQRSLTRAAKQREVLDQFAGSSHLSQLAMLAQKFVALRQLQLQIEELRALRDSAVNESATASELCAAFDRLEPEEGEPQSLDDAIALLTQSEDVRAALANVNTAINGDEDQGGGARSALHAAAREVQRLGQQHPSLAALSARISSAAAEVDDIALELHNCFESVESNPVELERLHARRSELMRLLRVTGVPDVATLQVFIARQRQVADPREMDAQIARCTEQRDALNAEIEALLTEVSVRRTKAAVQLADAVTERLQRLGLKGARFEVALPPANPGPTGAEHVSFLLATAEVAVPLGSGVSGGEMSRVALAIECALAGADPVPVMVFDEVDAGIGGQTAHEVAAALLDLARTTQVIVVTHLPQVAAYADHHLRVARDDKGTTVRSLSEGERVGEIARMLGETDGVVTARDLAAELLAARRTYLVSSIHSQ